MASSIIDKPLVYQGCKIPIYLDNNATEVRVLDLPLGISNDDVAKVMSKYGEILTITNDRWINFFPGIPNGVRTLRMLLKQPTPKSITVNNAAAAFVRFFDTIQSMATVDLLPYKTQELGLDYTLTAAAAAAQKKLKKMKKKKKKYHQQQLNDDDPLSPSRCCAAVESPDWGV
ncbi:conserved hypothetical protein [Culex quinquefasciatus]|uniref:Uncharacterized protein n=1 Tax=Culex quinquefasciatus TaxID=7176 RepID=B0WSP8_CULQU|nr:conserved hypothetical protein [Culex quinquefasciatus]|eukprot:XP_001853193.1 conserved hypothetical protein [Culex quinquefasciatus]